MYIYVHTSIFFLIMASCNVHSDDKELRIIETRIVDETTNNPIVNRLWEIGAIYKISCRIEVDDATSNGNFSAFRKPCLITESCEWNEVFFEIPNKTNSDREKVCEIHATTSKRPNSYQIYFGETLCVETDYLPSYIANGCGIDHTGRASTYYVGKEFELACYFDHEYLDLHLWRIDFDSGDPTMYLNESSEQFVISSHTSGHVTYSTLFTSNITLENNGNYTCVLKSNVNISIEYPTYQLSVSIPQAPYFDDPFDQEIEVEHGNFQNLNCTGHGDPEPTVHWYDQSNHTMHNGPIYRFNDENSAIFRCEIRNKYGIKSKYYNVSVVPSVEHTVSTDNKEKIDIKLVVLFTILIVILLLAFLLLMVTKIIEKWKIKKMHDRLTDDNSITLNELDPCNPMNEQFNNLRNNAEIIPSDQLTVTTEHLGDGYFGLVRKGILIADEKQQLEVAVKTPKIPSSSKHHSALIAELMVMSNIGTHINLLAVHGAVIERMKRSQQLCIVFELCQKGSLLDYLQRHRGSFVDQLVNKDFENLAQLGTQYDHVTKSYLENTTSSFLFRNEYYPFNDHVLYTANLLQYAYQIASGMKYLSQKEVVHRDLALRNILLTADHIVKIADFGLAFSQTNQPVKLSCDRLPLKWLAVESLFVNDFSPFSDMWSFGVVMWELFTLGEKPYQNEPEPTVDAFREFLSAGRRLPKPTFVPDLVWDLMQKCWAKEKNYRPTFDECKKNLGGVLFKEYPIASKSLFRLLNICQPYLNVTKNLKERVSCSADNLVYLVNNEIDTKEGYLSLHDKNGNYSSVEVDVETVV